MANSVILVTWVNKEYPEGISRQLSIPPDIDPRSLSDADIWDQCYNMGFNIYGAMTWEILLNNAHTCHQTDIQLKAGILYAALINRLHGDPEGLNLLGELYDIAYEAEEYD